MDFYNLILRQILMNLVVRQTKKFVMQLGNFFQINKNMTKKNANKKNNIEIKINNDNFLNKSIEYFGCDSLWNISWWYLWSNDFVFFDFAVFVTLPDLFILEDGPFDLMDNGPLRYGAFLDWFVLTADFIDLETSDFFPLVLRLKTVPFYSSGSSSYSSYPN